MKIKSDFVLQEVAGNWVAVSTGAQVVDFDGMVSLNPTGLFLWRALMEEKTEEKLVEELKETYKIDQATAEEGVRLFLQQLKENHLLEGT